LPWRAKSTFGRAAAACHVSPSTLSAAIRDLETELGVAVVERGKQFAGLTPEGRSVVEYAQRMAASAEGLKQELATLRDGLTGRLRLGVIPTALTVVAALTASFARRHAHVTAEVLSLATDEILARLRRFELDAGIVYVESAQVPGSRHCARLARAPCAADRRRRDASPGARR
jgi:DNA-binding transcriptional LysR family regulator